MLTLEMFNFILTAGGSAWMTMMAAKSADLAEERKWNSKQYTAAVAEADAARNTEGKWKGFYWVRGAMALVCAIYFFIVPMIAMLMGNVQVVIGYTDFIGLPFIGGDDVVIWIKLGSSAVDARILVYDPVKNNIMLSIIGMYFGNQMARRA
jgi:hypothetical protein